MADFVAVLKKTIDGLGYATPETRARVYDKARTTIDAKLAAISPPPPISVIDRQKASLERAIKEIEAEFAARKAVVTPADDFETIMKSLEVPIPLSASVTDPRRNPAQDPIRSAREVRPPPREPKVVEGPHFELRSGKLALSYLPPPDSEAAVQKELHDSLKGTVARLLPLLQPIENRYPELVNTVREYAVAIDVETTKLDVVSAWSIGSALVGFSQAYQQQNVERTLSEPLEPQVAGFLDAVLRLHGAFIMGFEKGRNLVYESDKFLLDTKTLEKIADPGIVLLDVVATNRSILEERTVRWNRPIVDFVHSYGWHTSRVGYSAYVLVRNIMFEIVRVAIGKQDNIASSAAQVMTLSAAFSPGGSEIILNTLPILSAYSSQILAFFNHSPEFRSYIEWALSVLSLDARVSSN